MELNLYQIAAFADRPFSGNPAAVVPLESWLDDVTMQNIAAENNLSETAFFVRADDGWRIRWFTPAVEVPLCGHATLASTAVIHQVLGHEDWPLVLQSASGPLTVDRDGDRYALDFPANPAQPVEMPADIAAALGDSPTECLLAGDIYMLTYRSEQAVASLAPDMAALAGPTSHGVIATAAGDNCDFVSRFFAPAIGIDEDPVTGVAHCVMTPYWAERLDKTRLGARQISARGGDVDCELRGDRVILRGEAGFFLRGTISVPD